MYINLIGGVMASILASSVVVRGVQDPVRSNQRL